MRFYRDVLGFPVVHSICAAGWGPEDHPDFIHFFFDIGNGDRIAFFYYFGAGRAIGGATDAKGDVYAGFGAEVPEFFVGPGTWRSTSTARRTCWSTGGGSTRARGRSRCRSSTRRSSRSTPTTPTATCSRSPARCGRSLRRRTWTPNLTIDALLDVVAEPEPTFGKLLARKAELIVEHAAEWEPAGAVTTLYVLDVPENIALPKVAAEDPDVAVGRIGPYFVIAPPGRS